MSHYNLLIYTHLNHKLQNFLIEPGIFKVQCDDSRTFLSDWNMLIIIVILEKDGTSILNYSTV